MNDPGTDKLRSVGGAIVLLGLLVAVGATAATILVARPRGLQELLLADRGDGGLRVEVPVDAGDTSSPGRFKSRSATPTADATSSATTTPSATTTVAASVASRQWSAQPGSESGADSDRRSPGTQPQERPGGTDAPDDATTPGAGDPDTPFRPGAPGAVQVHVEGRVRHAVWGTPLAGVTLTLQPAGLSAVTDADGRFAFAEAPAAALMLVSVAPADEGWRSHSGTMRSVSGSGPSAEADFSLYPTREAYGTEWRSAAEWSASGADLAPLLAKVGTASDTFGTLGSSEARGVLAGVRGGARDKARAELLAAWLCLASARLGFDAPVDTSQVAGGSRYESATSALGLVRLADRAVASGDADWSRVRRLLGERVLADLSTDQASLFVGDKDDGPDKKRRPGLD